MKKNTFYLGLAGLIFLFTGGIIYAIRAEMTTFSAVLIWGGVLFSVFYLYVNFPGIKAVFSGKAVRYGANAVIMVGIFGAILAMVAFMSMKYKVRWDLTSTKRYTLSEQTGKILKSLKKDVEVIAFYRSDERTRQAMQDVLDSYASTTSRFTYSFVDPDKKPGIAEKYGVTSYRTTIVMSGNMRENVSYESEEKLTNAILKVTKEDVKKIYFLVGHGENSTQDQEKTGYKAVKDSIEKENFVVKELNLVENPSVPEDSAVLVVSGPRKDILPVEFKRLSDYMDRGGSLLVMLDPYAAPALSDYLSSYGFQIGGDIIVDTMSKIFGANYLVPVVTSYENEHPITEGFDLMTFFPMTRSVAIERSPDAGRYVLAASGANSWAETDRKTLEQGKAEFSEDKDKRGPIPIASVSIKEVKTGEKGDNPQGKERRVFSKMVVMGDSDFANNTNINLAGNRDFFLNTLSWLAEEADLIAIRKKAAELTPVILTSIEARFIFWMSVIIPPSLIAVAGFGFFIRRRMRK